MGFVEDVAEIAELLDTWAAARSPLVTVDPPDAVRVGDVDADGWGEWRMIPSPVQPSDIDALEQELRVTLPPFYRAFLCCRVVLDLDVGDYTLPSIDCDDPLAEVAACLRASVGPGFVQFGYARGCGDPLCLDVMSRTEDGDCPVVVFNHDVVPRDVWAVRDDLERYAAVVSRSFRAFLTSLLTEDAAIFPPPESPEERSIADAIERSER